MAYEWRLEVRLPDGTAPEYITGGQPIESLDNFIRRGDGDCVEATFRGLATELDIFGRDIVTLQANKDNAGWVNVFRGVVTKPGGESSSKPSDFKLVGLPKRLYETRIESPWIPGGEIGAMVRYVMSQSQHRPPGVEYDPFLVHNFGLQLADRFPIFEYVGEFLEFMKGKVPGATCGVNADGFFFFSIPSGSHSFTVGTNAKDVVWRDVDLEEVVTGVTLQIPGVNMQGLKSSAFQWEGGAGLTGLIALVDGGFNVAVNHPSHSTYRAWKKVFWDNNQIPPYVYTSYPLYETHEPFPGATAALDGNPSTFYGNQALPAALVSGGNYISEIIYSSLPPYSGPPYPGRLPHGFEFIYESRVDLTIKFVRSAPATGDNSIYNVHTFTLPSTQVGEKRIEFKLVPMDVRAGISALPVGSYNVYFGTQAAYPIDLAANDIKIYSLRLVELDVAALENITASHYRLPSPDASSVIKDDDITEPRPFANVVVPGLVTLTNRKAALYKTSITKTEGGKGVRTVIELEQGYNAERIGADAMQRFRLARATADAINFRR